MARRTKEILGAVKMGNGRTFWTRIGTAFENSDSSWNLVFNYMPTNGQTTIQLRDRPKVDEPIAEAEASA